MPLPTLVEDSWSGHARPVERSWFEVYPITTKIEQKAGCKETQEYYSCKKYYGDVGVLTRVKTLDSVW